MMVLSWESDCGRMRANRINWYRFSNQEPVKDTLVLGKTDTIKVSLTTTEDSEAKRPHQAFVVITESTGLEVALPLDIKSTGKAVATIVCDYRFLHQ
jgi:oligosaccharyltransferase complex subunit delta (ribophorin II)